MSSTATPAARQPSPLRRAIVVLSAPVVLSSAVFAAVVVAEEGEAPATAPAAPGEADLVGRAGVGSPGSAGGPSATPAEIALLVADDRSLDGTGNNPSDAALGAAGAIYRRDAPANYADGIGEPESGPPVRYLSNRIFNDTNQNVFSENGVTHWSFVWGQFLDHTIALRESSDDESMEIAFDGADPLEDFTNDLGAITTDRSAVADGTGVDTPREQVNTVSSYIDGWAVYGGTEERLDWLREGTVDGDPSNNDARLLTADGYLPTAADRPDTDAPDTELMGRLFADPTAAVIAGDVRANENIGLTAVHTLFVREHNRIVESLPDDLDAETKFAIARRVVTALQQHITYNEFLPAVGVDLAPYAGYDPSVDPTITNEFATVGYRAHSQIHGEFEAEIPLDQLGDAGLATLERQGVDVDVDGDVVEVAVPLNVAFGNPGLLADIGLGNLLAGLSSEAAYANDEQIDNQLRSVLFQVPGPDVENPLVCLDGSEIAGCFTSVNDLGALDVLRGYDHGMPTYNQLRSAYGLGTVERFTELTGEDTEELPDGLSIDDPEILDFVTLADAAGNPLDPDSDAADGETVRAVRRSTTAARLKALFGDVDEVDAFTGMLAEPHVAGTEFGELQLAMWSHQFQALRDGDRFFYGNDGALDVIADVYGVDYRRSLADVIVDNTDVDPERVPANVFVVDDAEITDAANVGGAPSTGRDAAATERGEGDSGGDGRGDRSRRGPRDENGRGRPPREASAPRRA